MFYDLQASPGERDGHRIESTVELVIKAVSFLPGACTAQEHGADFFSFVQNLTKSGHENGHFHNMDSFFAFKPGVDVMRNLSLCFGVSSLFF